MAAADIVYYHGNNYRENNVCCIRYETKVEFKANGSVKLINGTRGNDARSDAIFWGEYQAYTGTYKVSDDCRHLHTVQGFMRSEVNSHDNGPREVIALIVRFYANPSYEAVFTKFEAWGNSGGSRKDCESWSASFAVSKGVCVITGDRRMKFMTLDNKTVSEAI